MTDLFIELLQVSVGTRDVLTRVPTASEWTFLLEEGQRQAIAGVLACGIERLPKEQQPPQSILLQWVGLTLQIEHRNTLTTAVCKQISDKFEEAGFKTCVLKGQANHRYYLDGMGNRRNCGDIDLWVAPREKVRGKKSEVSTVLSFVDANWERTGLCWLHCNFTDKSGVPVEVHFHPSFMNEPGKNRHFQRYFSNMGECVERLQIEGLELPVLKKEKDVVFQMNHIYRHLLDEGVGLRQIVDYFFLLTSDGEIDKLNVMRTVNRLGMRWFAGALMYVLHSVLGMPETYLLCPASEKDGQFLLNEIMLAGNFGHDDPRMTGLNTSSTLKRQLTQALRRFKRNLRFMTSYPGEVFWEPFARMWHFAWKTGIVKILV